MKTLSILPLLMLIVTFRTFGQYNASNLRMDPKANAAVWRYQNLQLFPIRANSTFAKENKTIGRYVPLKDGLLRKKLEISEQGGARSDGSVNSLFVENVSKDTIILLAGEVIQGGQQDRMIGQDVILYPKSGKKDVSVFCVEHGRWQAKEDGKAFKQYYTISSNEIRKAGAVKKDQNEVWKKVAETTDKNKAGTSTGTLTALKNSESYNAALSAYLTIFKEAFRADPDVIGMIAVSGDQVMGCDMFATHQLFAASYPNLLNSYATEVITSGKPITITYEKVTDYLRGFLQDESNQDKKIENNGTILKAGSKKIHISTF